MPCVGLTGVSKNPSCLGLSSSIQLPFPVAATFAYAGDRRGIQLTPPAFRFVQGTKDGR